MRNNNTLSELEGQASHLVNKAEGTPQPRQGVRKLQQREAYIVSVAAHYVARMQDVRNQPPHDGVKA